MTEERDFVLTPVGRVRSALEERKQAPHQGRGRGIEAVIELEAEYLPAAQEIRPGDTIWVLTWLHLANRDILRGHPKGNKDKPQRGVFSLRSPMRPNPIGLHLVDVVSVDGAEIKVSGMEALDGTPVVDIKPHVPGLDK